ncbi:MAG: MFS transporter [Planctomycetota bacterium]
MPRGDRARRAERFAWCLFDFANSAFNTIVITFVFSRFFAHELVGDARTGEVYWARALTVAGLAIAILSPVLGARADRTAAKKTYLIVLTLVTIACTAGLFFIRTAPGMDHASPVGIATALVLVTVAMVAFEVMFVFYNAFLPELAAGHELGRLSGFGWALGYAGGLLCLALCLLCVGIPGPEGGYLLAPWVSTEGALHIRTTNLIVAAWFLVFALPLFVLVRGGRAAPVPAAGGGSVREVLATLRRLPETPDLLRFLVARLFYNDALVALYTLSGLYMAETLAMSTSEVMLVAIGLNVVSGLGAVAFGYVDDFVGAKAALVGSLLLLLAGATLAVAIPTVPAFLVAGSLVGLGLGPNQAASRSMLARFADPQRQSELYGLFSLSGKATVWLGPLLFGVIRDRTDDQRLALMPLIGMFAIGLVILLTVDERRGARLAGRQD